jgi:hypothetical protein
MGYQNSARNGAFDPASNDADTASKRQIFEQGV